MTSRDFCFWLQGYLEIATAGAGPDIGPLEPTQVECVKRHLALVFKHEVDPSMGPPAHQSVLDALHHGLTPICSESASTSAPQPEETSAVKPFHRPPRMRC